jgi:hypothetical protein
VLHDPDSYLPCRILPNYHFSVYPSIAQISLVTGARQKIGYRCALKLLRCGSAVIATTRFPHDAAKRVRDPVN